MRGFNALILVAIAGALATGAAGCSHNKVTYDAGSSVAQNEKDKSENLQVEVLWLKNKGDTLDLLVSLRNNYKQVVSFKKTALRLTFNGRPGKIRKSELSGDMIQGTSEKGLLIFDFDSKLDKTGHATLEIDPISVEVSEGKKKAVPPLKLDIPVKS